MIENNPWYEAGEWNIESRPDGAVIVRVHSQDPSGAPLPDAVFSFRLGDPQYDFWRAHLTPQESPLPELRRSGS